jgi:hypothetical protein
MPSRPLIVAASLVALLVYSQPATGEAPAADVEFFERHIRPAMVEHCYGCHSASAEELQAGLRLDIVRGWRRGGDSGPAVVAGDPEASLLYKAIRYEGDVTPMPPEEKLPPEVIERFAEWISRGAAAPDDDSLPEGTPVAEHAAQAADHWAFQRPQPAVFEPTAEPDGLGARRIDRLIHHHLAAHQLSPSPAASRATLIRRLYFDLIGLPPEYHDVQDFVHREAPDAYEQLVERLLGSPRFGERWARYWLDVARFSDTKGYVFTQDRNYPDAYKFRDWVIDSLNKDRPFNDFIVYQLAADQRAPDEPDQLAAMGFLTLGRRFLNNRHDIIDDRIDVTTRGLMGLTVTCARCHDHKYDPIPAADYYSLYGVFASSREPGGEPSPLRLVDADELVTPVVFLRGQPGRRGPEVPRQFLALLAGPDRRPFEHGSGRLEMAQAIASPDNPLTARVLVNRVWGHLFGTHLVETPSDFGTRCPTPALQDVLDELAVEFVRHEWSVKWLVRELVLSSTYRQSSAQRDDLERIDPENGLYGRMNRRRLDFESMRDALLCVSGQLQAEPIGGASAEITGDDPSPRRSLYAHIDRQNFPGLFRVFDVASPDTHAPKRYETSVPQQALYLLNSPFAMQSAQRLADSTSRWADDPEERIVQLYRRILSRDPDASERQLAAEYLDASRGGEAESSTSVADDAWAQLSQILMISNEFFYLD